VQVREGYELWHPNREKAESKSMRVVVAFVLLISAALLVIITLGGWERLQSPGVGAMTIVWAGLYVLFAFLVLRWNRGLLPVASAMAIIMVIFAAVAANGWFARAKDGLDSPALPEDLLGVLTLVVIPVQILLIVVAMVAFNQAWNVEEERPIDGSPPHDEGESRSSGERATREDEQVTREDERPTASSPQARPATNAVADDPDWDDGPQRVSPAV
jgi:hypothetical protein